MRNKNQSRKTKILFVTLMMALVYITTLAQPCKQIYIAEAGTLRSYLTEQEAHELKGLILTGNINALDFKVLRDEFDQLERLDLTNVTIRMYTGKSGTYLDNKFYVYPKNCIPAYALNDKQTLKKVTLSPDIRNLEDGAFKGCMNLKICQIRKKKAPNLLPDALHPDSTAIFIPAGSKDEYRQDERWLPYNLIEGEPLEVSVHITEPGTLIDEIKKQGTHAYQIAFLTVSGKLDRADFDYIRTELPQLVSIDLSECNTNIIPAFSFNQKKYLMWVKLPRQLTAIGDRAFSGCIQLNGEIRLPATLQEIEYGAFIGCPKLKKIIFEGAKPEKIGENIVESDSKTILEYQSL